MIDIHRLDPAVGPIRPNITQFQHKIALSLLPSLQFALRALDYCCVVGWALPPTGLIS